jgi:DNA-binding transcriptional MocR family regulator
VSTAGALLPSIREIMERWEVSTTTARKVLDELAAAGCARKEGTRRHLDRGPATGASAVRGRPRTQGAPASRSTRRLTVWPVHAIPVNGSIDPDADNELAALDVRAERPPADAAMALGTQADGSSRQRSSPCSMGFSTVSEGGLERGNRCDFPGSGKSCNKSNTTGRGEFR